MANSGEDLSSTASHYSFSTTGDDEGKATSEESGWTSYIDYFMETQRHKEEVSRAAGDPSTDDIDAGAGRRCSSTSECSSDNTGVGASTWLPTTLIEPSAVVSRRMSLREKVLYDESLEDTATSPISSPKLIELIRDSDASHHPKKVNSCDEISCSKRKSTGRRCKKWGKHNNRHTAIKEDTAYDNNELKRPEERPLLGPYMSAFHV